MGRTDPIIGKRNYRVISRVFRLWIWLALPLASSLLALHYFCMAWVCENEGLKQHYELGKRLGVPILPIECHRFAPVLQKCSQSNGMAHPRTHTPNIKKRPRRSGADAKAYCFSFGGLSDGFLFGTMD